MKYKWGPAQLGTSGGSVTWSFGAAGSGKFYDFDGKITESAYQAAIRSAFETWSDVADIAFVEVSNAASAQIQLGWDRIDGGYNVLGEATYSFNGSNVLQRAEIRFDLAEAWSPQGDGRGAFNFFAVAVHEIGHAIGLDHTNEQDSIMFPQMQGQVGLSAHDIEDIRELYGAASGPVADVPISSVPTVRDTGSEHHAATFILDGDRARYDVRLDAEDILIRDLQPGANPIPQRLSGIERLIFDDGKLAFDIDGDAGQAYRLYQAAFDRVPDLDGLGFWINELDAGDCDGMTMAEGFIGSQEFVAKYGASGALMDADFIGLLYENVLDRIPDASEVAYWVGRFDGTDERAELLAFFADSTENRDNVQPAIDSGIWYV